MQSGCLKLTVLKILAKESQNGYRLMQAIGILLGRKPSPGSMYPLLKELHQKRLITSRKEDRQIVYSLTSAGKKHLQELMRHGNRFLEMMQQNITLMHQMLGENPQGVLRIVERISAGHAPFGAFTSQMIHFRDTALSAADTHLTSQQQQQIIMLLQKTTKEMQRICKK